MRKNITSVLILMSISLGMNAQELKTKANWQNLDYEKDGIRGMSVERTYEELLKGRPSQPVVVAVIDGGTDINHEDLKDKIWINTKEIPNNNKDDDKNGFVDDIHGWDFIGGKDGQDVHHEQLELTRIYKQLQEKYGNVPSQKLIDKNKEEYEFYQKLSTEFEEKSMESKQSAQFYQQILDNYLESEKILKEYLHTDQLNIEKVEAIQDNDVDKKIRGAKQTFRRFNTMGITPQDIQEGIEHFQNEEKYNYNLGFDGRSVVGDKPNKLEYGVYGNNEVVGPDAMHGSHVAGIIAANRNNNLGIKGVCENVQIMVVRTVPDGDERDKDVANAIRYAADNGAQIINMSFGKKYSPNKKWVDDAVKYAQEKGVLMIAAAGNDNLDTDVEKHYPTDSYEDGNIAANWISVGALSWKSGANIVASFSNYGKNSVDVFAPGVDIYSTIPGSKYEEKSGTSMAAPATTGVAALLKSYFPKLSAAQIKDIILKSSVKLDEEVNKPGTPKKVHFNELSTTGGIVNAYHAVKMAMELSK